MPLSLSLSLPGRYEKLEILSIRISVAWRGPNVIQGQAAAVAGAGAYAAGQEEEHTEEKKAEAAKFLNAIQCLVEETKEGKSVSEIITQRTPREMEEMQCIESQMAIVGALEKLGHADVTENIITEQMATDRIGLLNVIGTKALSSVLNDKAYTTEQVMVLFQPEDFEKPKVKRKVVKILNIAQEVNQAQVEGEN